MENKLSYLRNSTLHKTGKILYMLFNTVCMILLAYQIYLWLKSGTWVRIATNVIVPGYLAKWPDFSEWRVLGSIWNWILDVELIYTFSVFAMIFYFFRFIPDKQSKPTDNPSITAIQE
ncbi:MAG: hypothetical protein NT010_10100 [Proteobacteria bacterium]|nr:hypothetical protein [Pseudomonadota bacterium]